jgi:hypothetical protein
MFSDMIDDTYTEPSAMADSTTNEVGELLSFENIDSWVLGVADMLPMSCRRTAL